ncbi:unnamed protein product [Prunus armeniaca]|uniref:Uncharacterized protein n=1 Tax=Prunus armeniaca TaxID=36596 RepID=A0A6J5WCI8_PRUAR|nr:unnamed protein product [Prunus armeniaca]CAB4298061.1 unnamed protein product [Prunus armeniaca]
MGRRLGNNGALSWSRSLHKSLARSENVLLSHSSHRIETTTALLISDFLDIVKNELHILC